MRWGSKRSPEEHAATGMVHDEFLTLRAALDHVPYGVVLLDSELRAQFINRAFRKMWRLPDSKADGKPAFVALMYHGRDTRAYDVPESELDAYVARRVAYVKAGNPTPVDVRLHSGEIIRFQCTVLPAGGRMLSYTYVTDIVRHSDELEVLRVALDNVEQGVILLDGELTTQFMNRAARRLWRVSDEQVDRKPPYSKLVNDARFTHAYAVPPAELDEFISRRIARVRAGDPTPTDLRVSDGRLIRSQCTVLAGGGRMLTYTDVTDLVRNAEQLQRLATTDELTGLSNRRHFLALAEAEWSRFQRYHRPLSLLVLDIDHFKSINDGFGHDVGDRMLMHLASLCKQCKRCLDVAARLGGDEFVVLLPETELAQAEIVADRLRQELAKHPLIADGSRIPMTVSIGVAGAALSMSGIDALIRLADRSLYQAKADGRNRRVSAVSTPITGYNLAAE